MYRTIVHPMVLVLMAFHACQLPIGNQGENNASEELKDTTMIVHEELIESPDTTVQANPPAFVLDE